MEIFAKCGKVVSVSEKFVIHKFLVLFSLGSNAPALSLSFFPTCEIYYTEREREVEETKMKKTQK